MKQYPTTNTKSTDSSPCDFNGFIPTIPTNQNYPLSHDQEITFIIKFDSHPKNDFYVFVYLGSRNILSSFVFHIDTQSVNHYQGNLAFKIERSVTPKPKVQFSSVFHTEGDSTNDDERTLLSFKKLFPEMYCPVKTETFCDLSESCINDTVPCRDKTGNVMLLKNDFKQNLINLDTIPVNRVEKITVVLSGKNVLLYPVIGHHHGDYPGPEIENDIEINILHRKSSTHHSEYATKYSPIDFEHKNLKIPIEKEDILDEASNDRFEGVKGH